MKLLLRRLIHRLAHLTGWNEGHVETWWETDDLWVGFRCDGCGQLFDKHLAPHQISGKEVK